MRLAAAYWKSFRWAAYAAGIAGMLAIAGCSDGKIRRYPVTGTVNVDRKAAVGAVVTFCPVGVSDEMQKLRPFGTVGADGTFQLTTLNNGDGAPVGNYKVLIDWPATSGGDPRTGGPGPDRLRGRYGKLDKSQLSVEVKAENNELPPFELKSR